MRTVTAPGLGAAQAPSGLAGRLDDFRLGGRLWPVLAFVALAAAFYLWGSTLAVTVLVKLWSAYAVAFLVLAALRALEGPDPGWRYVLPVALVGVALGGVGAAAVAAGAPGPALDRAELAWEWAVGAAFSAFFVGVSLATSEVRRRDQIASETKRQLAEARLQTLTAQIEPHFLMNTLANLRYLIKIDSAAAAEMLEHLADLLQGALERSRSQHSTLGQEMQLVESYLAIMRIRLGQRLRFETVLPEDLKDTPFPPLLLQTLVENAVRHGVEPHGGDGRIEVSASRDGNRIVVAVADDGVGLSQSAGSSSGHGLRNTRERLETFYQGRATLELRNASPSGTIAAISIPASA